MFSLLFLKEEEKGNIDLNKKYSDYSKILLNVDVPIIDSLKFAHEIRTDGRVDDESLSKEELFKRFKNAYVFKKYTYKYNDIPYMLVPLLFGEDLEDSTYNYLKKFYSFYRSIGLSETGYSKIDMTGGIVDINLNDGKYYKSGVYDPKARIFENMGYISSHAGLTSTTNDLELLFKNLCNGLLSNSSFEKLISPFYTNLEFLRKNKGKLKLNEEEVFVNKALGVFINVGDITLSDVGQFYSDCAFGAQGSTGTYCIFDLENGFMSTILSNVKSSLYSKYVNYNGENLTVFGGTHSKCDGSVLNDDIKSFNKLLNTMKEESFKTLFKLRLLKMYIMENNILCSSKEIYDMFNKTLKL